MSIEYDGTGDSSSDWSEDAYTPCMSNLIPGGGAVGSLELTVFPNPTQDVLNVRFESFPEAEGDVNIYDSMGKVVFTKNVDMEKTVSLPINISDFHNGVYFMKVKSKNRTTVKQFIKQ